MKTGPLTKADFLKLWTSAMDSGYTRPLVEGGLGSGYEVWDQAFDQGAALSQEIDTGTQGLYINPSSSQSDIPATGGIAATVTLTVTRSTNLGVSVSFAPGQLFGEVATDHSATGAVSVATGREYFCSETTLAPGEASRTFNVTADVVGFGGNYPQPGTITAIEQVGQIRSASGANVFL